MRLLIFFSLMCLLGCGASTSEAPTETVDIKVLSKGKVIDLEPHIKKGSITVFDFYADWCAPCKKLDRSLVDMKKIYGDKITIHKLDLVDWKSDLAKHHQIRDLPYLMVYDRDGGLLKKGPSVDVLPVLMEQLNN